MNFSEKYNNGNSELSKRLNRLRKKHNLTQAKLAEEIVNHGGECSASNYVSMIETGKRSISKQNARALAAIFGINENFLLDENYKYETSADKLKAEIKDRNEKSKSVLYNANQEAYYIQKSIYCLASLNGYTVEIKDIAAEIQKAILTNGANMTDCLNDDYMIFYRNGEKEFSLSYEDVISFGNNLSDIFMSHIKWNIKKS